MKKYLYFLFVALFATMSFALTSCGDDDDEPNNETIVGTWENVSEWASALGTQQYVKFQNDGHYYEVNIDSNDGEVEVLRGQWKQDGNTVKVFGDGVESINATITNLTKSSMTITAMGISQSYKRASDSDIEKYL